MTEPGRERPQQIGRLVALALLLLASVAILAQHFVLPMGVQNQGRETWNLLALAALAATGFGASVLAVCLRAGPACPAWLDRAAGLVGGSVFLFVVLELTLALLDVSVVSRGPRAMLGGPYQEVRTAAGEWATFKKAHPASEFGFRTVERWPERGEALRVLFLGDSYTEGSGRATACNYPEVAAARLASASGRPTRPLNAGVAGHGPRDSLTVLRHLIASGIVFDAVVHQVFLENDFTDNLPGTERRVMAGMLFRVPRSAFLQMFHPLNGRSAHWALLIGELARGAGTAAVAHRDDGECRLEPEADPAEPLAWTDRHMTERFRGNYGPEPRIAPEEVAAAQRAIAAETAALGVPLVRVVFPDRILADPEARERLGIRLDAAGIDVDRLRRHLREVPGATVDLGEVLVGAENYARDTHLSDLGNLRAGEAVGDALAELLAPGAVTREGSEASP